MIIKTITVNYDKVLFLACNDISKDLQELNLLGIDARAIDYDPKFKDKEYYINKDFVFDDVNLDADLTVHMNVEKTYPVKLSGDVILRGDNQEHNGDCCPIRSCDELIELFNVKEVYETYVKEDDILDKKSNNILVPKKHFFVYGRAETCYNKLWYLGRDGSICNLNMPK